MADALRSQLGEGIAANWRQLGALEQVLTEIAEEVDGEDPLHPEVRELLDKCRAQLLELRDKLQPYTGSLRQEEPAAELVERLQRIVRDG